jgi:hypothetical protein
MQEMDKEGAPPDDLLAKLEALPDEFLTKLKEGFAERDKAPWAFWEALQIAARDYEDHKRESAALAVRAALRFVDWMHWSEHLRAPLLEAADILENGVDPDRRATYVRALRVTKNIGVDHPTDAGIAEDDPWLTKAVQDKIIGSVAVELQLRCGVKLENALRNVVGRDASAAKKLKDFRNNMKRLDSPKGARKTYYDLIQASLNGSSPGDAADRALKYYHALCGKKS